MVVALTSCGVAAITTASAQNLTSIATLERSPISPVSVVHEYVPSSLVPGQATIPSNLKITPLYREVVERMLRRSPTFRRQLLRIAGVQQLTVQLQTTVRLWMRDARATTEFVRKSDGRLVARIDISPLDNDVELIAHELEHVIEQLDEIDLAAKAAQPNSGVHRSTSGGALFETTRAVHIGLQVAQEVQ
jgi:hypothetical protein